MRKYPKPKQWLFKNIAFAKIGANFFTILLGFSSYFFIGACISFRFVSIIGGGPECPCRKDWVNHEYYSGKGLTDYVTAVTFLYKCEILTVRPWAVLLSLFIGLSPIFILNIFSG